MTEERLFPCSGFGRGGFPSRYPAEDGRARKAVQAEASRGFAATIEAGDHLPVNIHNLALYSDLQTGKGIVEDRSGPGRIEWRFVDLEL